MSYLKRIEGGEGTAQGTYRNGKGIGSKVPAGMNTGEGVGLAEDGWDHIDVGEIEYCMGAATQEAEGLDPGTLEEARGRSDWPRWEEAMQKELDALKRAGTWKVVPRPEEKNIVDCKWVFHIKRNANGNIKKYKARLVARGFTQIYGTDYMETFAPVAKLSSLCTIIAFANRKDWSIEVFDFNSAFFNSVLNKEIYMNLPPG